jgi:Tol biopolymer transport system component
VTAQAASPPSGKIVFVSFDNSLTSDLFSINPDGTGLKNLTNTPNIFEEWPNVSRDGSKIVFRVGDNPSSWELYSSDANGSNMRRLTNDGFAEESPQWTPDGKQIIFSSNRNDVDPNCGLPPCNWDIFIMRADGTHIRQLTTGLNQALFANVSPDGRKVLFSVVGTSDGALYTMNIDGSGVSRVDTPAALEAGDGEWSPSGSRIVFSSNTCFACAQSDIWTVNPDGSGLTQVTANNLNEISSTWSPDGRWIVYEQRGFAPNPDVVRIRPDGTGKTNVTQNVHGGGTLPSWGP